MTKILIFLGFFISSGILWNYSETGKIYQLPKISKKNYILALLFTAIFATIIFTT